MATYQDLVDQHGFAGQYNSVKRFAAKLRQKEPEQFVRWPPESPDTVHRLSFR
jgi:hypothetical protein